MTLQLDAESVVYLQDFLENSCGWECVSRYQHREAWLASCMWHDSEAMI